jgi:hypothetical protein
MRKDTHLVDDSSTSNYIVTGVIVSTLLKKYNRWKPHISEIDNWLQCYWDFAVFYCWKASHCWRQIEFTLCWAKVWQIEILYLVDNVFPNPVLLFIEKKWDYYFNTLRTGDADLRVYITTVQDGWRKSAF